MAAETGFRINDELYEVPTLDSLDLDERYILYDYCELATQDFLREEDETEEEHDERCRHLMRHPGFWPALHHIAYRRKHRDVTEAKLKKLVMAANRDLDSFLTVMEPTSEAGPDAGPPELTTEPEKSLPGSSVDSSESSGTDGSVSSAEGSGRLATITTFESPTSRTSDQTSSAA